MAQTQHFDKGRLSTELTLENGREPASGFELAASFAASGEHPTRLTMSILHSIAAARNEVQALLEMSQDLGNSLSLLLRNSSAYFGPHWPCLWEGLSGVVGVLTLYHTAKDAFTRDHLRIVLGLSAKISLAIENALKFRQVECSASTDYLTQLPNARSLFPHLENQIARSKRSGGKLAILVCLLDAFKQVNDRYGHLEREPRPPAHR